MEAAFIAIGIVAIVIQIWLIYLFVSLAKNVKRIANKVAVDDKNINLISWKAVQFAVVTSTRKELYDQMVACAFNLLYDKCTKTTGYKIALPPSEMAEMVNKRLARLERFSKYLGFDFPAQLSNMESFVGFYNTMPNKSEKTPDAV